MLKICSFKKVISVLILASIVLTSIHLYSQYISDKLPIYVQYLKSSGLCNETDPKAVMCDCNRSKIPVAIADKLSTCDYFSTARDGDQNVASFSLFGNTSSLYFKGVEPSIIGVAKFYPGWVMRLYHNINSSDPQQNSEICKLWCKYPHLDLCNVRNLPFPLCDQSRVFGMVWRFIPLGDPLVKRFIVRDLDSPILQREVDAVNDWIQRNKTFHIMRDHPYHVVPMLGGMWGAEIRNRSLMASLQQQLLMKGTIWKKGEDQNLLQNILWPHTFNDSVAHDSYLCKNFPNSIPFPSRRDNLSYVGMIYNWRPTHKLSNPCPKQCRPLDHQDWEYC